jgi:hypothetical protein
MSRSSVSYAGAFAAGRGPGTFSAHYYFDMTSFLFLILARRCPINDDIWIGAAIGGIWVSAY